MAAGATYTPIATTTLSSAASTVTFSSISGDYTDLVLVCSPAQTTEAEGDLNFRFNSDTGYNYSYVRLTGDGSSASSSIVSNNNFIRFENYGYPSSTLGNSNQIIQVMNYSNATTYKTSLGRANSAETGLEASVGMWRNTAAITSITCLMNVGQLKSGSTFTLYGIKAA
jgi:hypothetical protein